MTTRCERCKSTDGFITRGVPPNSRVVRCEHHPETRVREWWTQLDNSAPRCRECHQPLRSAKERKFCSAACRFQHKKRIAKMKVKS
jgi:hypothetical protein